MLGLFDAVKDKLKIKLDATTIDNWIFKLHYRVTTVIFLIATILVTSREFIGESIRCIDDMKDPGFTKVVETFCFFNSTFTLVEDPDLDRKAQGLLSHPGLGVPGFKQPIRRHSYYQWVPFFLFAQAIAFYLTHLLWKKFEDGRIAKTMVGLRHSAYAVLDKEVEVAGQAIPTKRQKLGCIHRLKEEFLERISLHRSWCVGLVTCEILNVLHVVLEVYLTDKFLGKEFFFLGMNVTKRGTKALDDVFPKMAKCTFNKYGPSGSIQLHDALCVMALNIINEKIFVFLWFWFAVLFAASCLILIWRLFTLSLYSRSVTFNQIVFGKLHPWRVTAFVRDRSYADWLFLKYLSKNIDSLTFKQLMVNLSGDPEDRKPFYVKTSGKFQ